MTRDTFIVAIAILLSVTLCSLSAQNVSKDYNIGRFSVISLQSVGNIISIQLAGCTCCLGGPSEFVERIGVAVKNGTLVTSYKNKNTKNVKNLTFYITTPDLNKVKIGGVGNFDAKEELKLKNIASEFDGVGNYSVKSLYCDGLKLDVDGVGDMKLNVDCSTIKAKMDGVGNITVLDKANAAFFKQDGVDKINSRDLRCKDVIEKGWNF